MSAARPWLLPLVPLYAAGLAWKGRGFERKAGHVQRLEYPVVSVGSLSAGGAGKTPFVIALVEALRRAGVGVDVLSRGYGRQSTESLRVDANGSAEQFGDEPLLMARRLACPVYVAGQRFRAGQMAETDRRLARHDRQLSVHVLDDGFQHRQLERAVDIVLLTARDATDTLLPAGNLREPLRALRRADVVVLSAEEADQTRAVVERVCAGTAVPKTWIIERRSAIVEGQVSERPMAVCGIARPEDFRASLAGLGLSPCGMIALRDHQRYDDALVKKLVARARAAGTDGFVTTAKDAVKLTPRVRGAMSVIGPLAVSDVMVHLLDEQRCMAELIAALKTWRERR